MVRLSRSTLSVHLGRVSPRAGLLASSSAPLLLSRGPQGLVCVDSEWHHEKYTLLRPLLCEIQTASPSQASLRSRPRCFHLFSAACSLGGVVSYFRKQTFLSEKNAPQSPPVVMHPILRRGAVAPAVEPCDKQRRPKINRGQICQRLSRAASRAGQGVATGEGLLGLGPFTAHRMVIYLVGWSPISR